MDSQTKVIQQIAILKQGIVYILRGQNKGYVFMMMLLQTNDKLINNKIVSSAKKIDKEAQRSE